MNENYIKEYEEMSLCDFADELVEPLCTIKKDLAKTIYIHYAEERDKNDELEKENEELKSVINDIKHILNNQMDYREYVDIVNAIEETLDKEEKEYLRAVIKPFRDRVKYIEKNFDDDREYISITVNNDWLCLPYFKKGTMYKGMEVKIKYSLEELGL